MPRKKYDAFRLIPRGVDLDEEQIPDYNEAISDSVINDIDMYRAKGLSVLADRLERSQQRTEEYEKERTHKFAYLSELKPEQIHEKEIVYLLADRYTIFNKKYQIFHINRGLFIVGRKRTGIAREEQFEYCLNTAVKSTCVDEYTRNRMAIWLKALEALASDRNLSLPEMYDELLSNMEINVQNDENLICDRLWSTLGLASDMTLSEYESRIFCLRVIPEYKNVYRYITILKEESTNYVPEFNSRELACIREDMLRTSQLRCIIDEYIKWCKKRIDFPSIDLEISSCHEQKDNEYIGKYINLTEEQIQRVRDSSEKYIHVHNKDARKIDLPRIRRLMDSIFESLGVNNSEQLFPIVYLMACTADIRVLSYDLTVNVDKLKKVLKDPYTLRPSQKEQRITAIRFLRELISICCAENKEEVENWRLFLQSYGADILSREEAELWKDIIRKLRRDAKTCILPPVELVLLGSEFLKECCPLDYSGLYSYESGSVIHTGGFMRFLKENPNIVRECASRMTDEKWTHTMRSYAEKVNRIKCDIEKIKELCGKCSEKLYWNKISGASDTELYNFCRKLYAGTPDDRRILRNMMELRALIVEAAMVYSLSERGKQRLKKAFNVIFNARSAQQSDYQIDFNINLIEF